MTLLDRIKRTDPRSRKVLDWRRNDRPHKPRAAVSPAVRRAQAGTLPTADYSGAMVATRGYDQ